MQLIDDGALRPSKIITHRLAVDEIPSVRIPPASRLLAQPLVHGVPLTAAGAAQAYDMIYAREKEMLGVVFEWDVSAERGAKLLALDLDEPQMNRMACSPNLLAQHDIHL